jgi:hypothetical protein
MEEKPVHQNPARMINLALGVWLFISAFAWPHSHAQMTNTWIIGVLCVVFAIVAMATPPARYLITALSVWLFVSAWVLPSMNVGTIWNNVLVAVASFIVSLIPSGPVGSTTFPSGKPAH